MGPRSFWIQITGQKMCFTPTKTLVCATSLVSLSLVSTRLRLQSHPNPIQAPITPGLGPGLGLRGQDVIKLTTDLFFK